MMGHYSANSFSVRFLWKVISISVVFLGRAASMNAWTSVDCGSILSEYSLNVGRYRANTRKCWTVTSPPGYVVKAKINVGKGGIQSSRNCAQDVLAVFDGGSTQTDAKERICAETSQTVESSERSLTIGFKSDRRRNGRGFSVKFSFVRKDPPGPPILNGLVGHRFTLSSPLSGKLTLDLTLEKDALSYRVYSGDVLVIKDSKLRLSVNNRNPWGLELINGWKISSISDPWDMVWGEQETVQNAYTKLVVNFSSRHPQIRVFGIEFRLFDDGVAFRYSLPSASDNRAVTLRDFSQFCLDKPEGFTAWSTHSWNQYIGPYPLNQYNKRKPKTPSNGCETPITSTNSNFYLSFHEGALVKGNAVKVGYQNDCLVFTGTNRIKLKQGFSSAFRTIQLTETAEALLESRLILNLNEPNVLDDVSWIKPGVAMWDWRIFDAVEEGFTYHQDTESFSRMINFAAKSDVPYVLVDAGWYGHEFSPRANPTTYEERIDIPKLAALARSQSVGLWLYINTVALSRYNLDTVFKQYQDWGVVGIKHGFLYGSNAQKLSLHLKVLRAAAKYKLMYILHEPGKPTGLRRTYPHFMATEYTTAMLDGKYARPLYPKDLCTSPFVNALPGPVDRSPGMFALDSHITRDKNWRQIPSTIVSQIAQGMIMFTGFWSLVDTPEQYEKKADLFNFISRIPLTWKNSRVLHAQIGKLITVVRESYDNEFFLCSLANEAGSNFELPFDFLTSKKTYSLKIFEDDENADYFFKGPERKVDGPIVPQKTNRELYQVVTKARVRSDDKIKVNIAKGGGYCAIFTPV